MTGQTDFDLNAFQNNKFLGLSNLKAFADDKVSVTKKLRTVLGRLENIVEKGENAGYQHFLLFPLCFKKGSFSMVLKSLDCVFRIKYYALLYAELFTRQNKMCL